MGSLASSTSSFQNTLLSATDLDYKRVSRQFLASVCSYYFCGLLICGYVLYLTQKHRQLQHETSETLVSNLFLGSRFFAKVNSPVLFFF